MNVVLLIGAPGAGKSTLGNYLSRKHGCQFLSAGEWIREQGLLHVSDLREKAAALLERTLSGSGLLILEYAKDIDDAYILMKLLGKHGATLAQVVLVTDRTMSGRIGSLLQEKMRVSSWNRDLERKVAERTPKWQANAGLMVEFFSSMGILYTLVPQIWGKKSMTGMHPFIAAAESLDGPLDRLLPNGLALQRMDWMVSPRLVTDKAIVEQVGHEAAACAGLKALKLLVPHAVVRSDHDVKWVTSCGLYKISHKCDGTRYLLIVTEDGSHFFKNRAGFVYSYPVSSKLPNKTILDGELVWGLTQGYFFAFDCVMFAGKRVWNLPLQERLEAMSGLTSDESLLPLQFTDQGLHRQRAPSEHAVVEVVAKRYFDSLPDSVPSYPVDGLIFTPKSMPYVLAGLLTYKWQPKTKRACDIRGENHLVYECVHSPRSGWQPVAIRWDKTSGCSERINLKCHIRSLLQGPENLVCHTPAPILPDFPGMKRKTLSKDQCIKNSLIERTLDNNTGLEIFNRTLAGRHIPCRGIVFDGDRLVAAAFESFEATPAIPHAASKWFNSWKRKAKSQFEAWKTRDFANASFKFDGTLIIAFVHNNAVRVCTRRRMDSEQAIWAQKWLADHAHLDAFLEGWTYAFEAVYSTNTVVICYPFEGLVFLDAWSPDGMSTAPLDRPALSKKLGAAMCAPSIQCRTSDLWRLLAVPQLSLEGWVVENGGMRTKLVHPTYKNASRLNLHPVRVWYDVRMGKSDRTMPEHFRNERLAIVAALEKAFDEEKNKLEFEFDAAATWDNDITWDNDMAVLVPVNSSRLRTVMAHVEKGAEPIQTVFHAMGFDDPKTLSMHYKCNRFFGLLRVELMDRIRPSDSGEMRYYTPSANFAQTFAKGWKRGPGFVTPLILSMLDSTGVMDHVFRNMPMEEVAKAILVCKSWLQTITQDGDFHMRVVQFLEEEKAKFARSHDNSDDDQWGFTQHHYENDGYGSY